MKIYYSLIVSSLLFFCSGEMEAQRGYNFPRETEACDGMDFQTSTLGITPVVTPVPVFVGWYRLDGTLYSGSMNTSIRVSLPSVTLVLYSRSPDGLTNYHDTLVITARPKPWILLKDHDTTICAGSTIVADVDSAFSVETIIWTTRTGIVYNRRDNITLTETTEFTITASNSICLNDAMETYRVTVLQYVDTNMLYLMTDPKPVVKICPGCRKSLNDLVAYSSDVDSVAIESPPLTWMQLSGTGSFTLPDSVGAPVSGTDHYITYFTGTLYGKNSCGTVAKYVVNVPYEVFVQRSNCDLTAMWADNSAAIYTAMPCNTYDIVITNPQPDGFKFTQVKVESATGSEITFRDTILRNGSMLWMYEYDALDDDTISVEVHYLNDCDNSTSVYKSKLHFYSKAKPECEAEFCPCDTLPLEFFIPFDANVVLDSVVFVNHKGDFQLKRWSQNWEDYEYKDTIFSWKREDTIAVVVHYHVCDSAKQKYMVFTPALGAKEDCDPQIEMPSYACRGDTNSLRLSEKRLPRAFIQSFSWLNLPPQIDTLGVAPALTIQQYENKVQYQRFISYNNTAQWLRYQVEYNQGGQIKTIIDSVPNKTRADNQCSPTLIVPDQTPCRGTEIEARVLLRNFTGRLQSAQWSMTTGEMEKDSIKMQINSSSKTPEYYYSVRVQKTGTLKCAVEYYFGDSIKTVETTTPISVRSDWETDNVALELSNCRYAYKASTKDHFCGGDTIGFSLEGDLGSTDTLVSIVWDPPMETKSSTVVDEYNFTHPPITVTKDSTITFTATVKVVDYFGDTVTYKLPKQIFIRPYPAIFNRDEVDVCQDAEIDINQFVNYTSRPWTLACIAGAVTCTLALDPLSTRTVTVSGQLNLQLKPGENQHTYVAHATVASTHICGSMTNPAIIHDSITLVRNLPAAVEVKSFPVICENDLVNLNAYALADQMGTITWVKKSRAGIDTIHREVKTTDSLYHRISDTAWYCAIYTTACGTAIDSQKLQPKIAPKLDIGKDTTICLYDSLILNVIPNEPIDNTTIRWYWNTDTVNSSTFTARANDTVPFEITVMAQGITNSCHGLSTITITPQKLPEVKIMQQGGDPDDSTICAAIYTRFTLTANGANNYKWIYPDSGTRSSVTIDSATVSTVYSVIGYDAKGCKNVGRFYVSVIPPDVYIASRKDSVCERAPYEVFPTDFPDVIPRWKTPNGSLIDTLRIANMSATDTGIYKLIRTQYGCQDTTELRLKMKPVPKPDIQSQHTATTDGWALCVNTPLQLTGSSTDAIPTDQYWITPNGIINATSIVALAQIHQPDSGIYKFVVELNGCIDSISKRIRVDSMPKPDFTTDKSFYCAGDMVNFTYFPENAERYQLQLCSMHSGENPIILAQECDSGTAVLTVNHLTCQDSVKKSIDVRYRPDPQLIVKSQYCETDTLIIQVIPENDVNYQWTNDQGFTDNQVNLILENITLNDSGNYYLSASVNGCTSYPDTAKIVIFPLPIISFVNTPDYVCGGDTLRIDVYRPNATYLWNTGDTDASIEVTSGGQYTVMVTENQCSNSNSVNIKEREKPKFTLPDDTTICYNTYLTIRPQFAGANDDVNYLWSNGSTADFIEVNEVGLYTLTTERESCTWKAGMNLMHRFCGVLNFPAAFRPESEIVANRKFQAITNISKDILTYEIYIYDKWGKLMFKSNDIDEGWDGTYNGILCHPSVYVYVVQAHETLNGTDLSTKGTVTLIQ